MNRNREFWWFVGLCVVVVVMLILDVWLVRVWPYCVGDLRMEGL